MSPRSWFLQEPMGQVVDIGNIITLDQPHSHPSKWRILEILHENDYQNYEGADEPSYASIQLSCAEVGGSRRRAFMRIVMQIPFSKTEHEDSAVRGKQATSTTFRTPEFLAFMTFAKNASTVTPHFLGYCDDRQGSSGPVPGGFITYYAWEVVPGKPLGDDTGDANEFWTLDKDERDKIRSAFKATFLKVTSMGILPDCAGPHNLFWNSKTGTLTWVGFWDCEDIKPMPWKEQWLPAFDLVHAPNSIWVDSSWPGSTLTLDTSGWEY